MVQKMNSIKFGGVKTLKQDKSCTGGRFYKIPYRVRGTSKLQIKHTKQVKGQSVRKVKNQAPAICI